MPQSYEDDHNIARMKTLPRRDLRPEAFAKYEPYMAQAIIKGHLVVPPWEFPSSKRKPMKSASTFICRFQDAKTAYRRFGYKSSLIPKDFNMDNLTICELADGGVLIENMQYSGQKGAAPILSSDHTMILALAGKIKRGELHTNTRIPIKMMDETYDIDLKFIEDLQAEGSEFYGHFATTPRPENGLLWVLMD